MPKTIIKPLRPVINRAHPLAKGLVACYPFFERGGTTLRDISGKNNNGTLTNMDPATDWVRTPRGYGLDFDGTNDYVSVPNNSSLNTFPNGITLSAWVKINAIGYNGIIAKRNGANNDAGYAILTTAVTGYPLRFAITTGVGIIYFDSLSTISTGIYYQVSATYNPSTGLMAIYINGVLDRSQTVTASPLSIGTTNLAIGTRSDFAADFMNGTIDEVRIYNRVLTAKEIAQDYADPFSLYRFPQRRLGKSIIIPPVGGSFFQASKYW